MKLKNVNLWWLVNVVLDYVFRLLLHVDSFFSKRLSQSDPVNKYQELRTAGYPLFNEGILTLNSVMTLWRNREHNQFPMNGQDAEKSECWRIHFCQCLIAFIGRAQRLLILDYDAALTADCLFTRHLLAAVDIMRQIPPITLITSPPGPCHCQELSRMTHRPRLCWRWLKSFLN